MLFDILIILILILFVVVGFFRGALKSVAGLLAFVAAILIAVYFSKLSANWFYETFILDELVNGVSTTLKDFSANSLTQGIEAFLQSLPKYIANALTSSGVDLQNFFSEMYSSSADIISSSVETTLKPVFISIFTFVFGILYFLLVFIVLKVIVHFACKVAKLPLLNTVNRVLGCVIGLIYGVMFVLFIVIITYFSNENFESFTKISDFLKINNSYIFNSLISGNIDILF